MTQSRARATAATTGPASAAQVVLKTTGAQGTHQTHAHLTPTHQPYRASRISAWYLGTGTVAGTSPCGLCVAGKYCAGGETNLAVSCPVNSTSPIGSSSLSQCYCPAGYVGNNGTACALCPAGSLCTSGNSSSCPANSFAPAGSSSLDSCTCNAGFYGTGPTGCTQCPANSYCPAGSTAHTPCTTNALSPAQSASYTACTCDRGWVGVANAVCTVCPVGSWCWTGQSTQCPAQSTSIAGMSWQGNCTCNAGYYSADIQTSGVCTACIPGQYCPAGAKQTLSCAAGYYCPNATVQLGCQQGTFCPSGSSATSPCQTCQSNSAQNVSFPTLSKTDVSTCSCNAGYFTNGVSTPTTQLQCLQCDAGTYGTAIGATASPCLPCAAGTFSTALLLNTASNCIPCTAGTFSTALGLPASGV